MLPVVIKLYRDTDPAKSPKYPSAPKYPNVCLPVIELLRPPLPKRAERVGPNCVLILAPTLCPGLCVCSMLLQKSSQGRPSLWSRHPCHVSWNFLRPSLYARSVCAQRERSGLAERWLLKVIKTLWGYDYTRDDHRRGRRAAWLVIRRPPALPDRSPLYAAATQPKQVKGKPQDRLGSGPELRPLLLESDSTRPPVRQCRTASPPPSPLKYSNYYYYFYYYYYYLPCKLQTSILLCT